MSSSAIRSRSFRVGNPLLWLILLTLLAWLLREYFVLFTVIEIPIRGDIRQYVAYAWNLIHHGTFSYVWPGSATPVPDAFRSPGYPWFLAVCMLLADDYWYGFALHAQAVLGALTVTFTVMLARHWLLAGWALCAGMLVALWPHHIAATDALLSEVVLGFALVLALWLTVEALQRKSLRWAMAAGIAFSYAALVNPITLLFPLPLAWLMWRERMPRPALALLVLAMLGPTLWGVRNLATVPPTDAPGRAAMNLVQGSWPQYHRAYISRNASPIAHDILLAIHDEIDLLASDHAAGLDAMSTRMARDPAWYARWYLIEKPYLLWDWDIRMGAGDVYFHRLTHSPLEENPALHVTKLALKRLNPAIFVLSMLASVILLAGCLRRRPWAPTAAVMVAGLCIYVTLVHMVFQAEPRYSIPYRPMQLLMAVTSLALAWQWWQSRRLTQAK